MERTLSPEEKIRRAEEIYARRRSGYTRNAVATVNVSDEKNYGLFRKMILQMAICLLIYFIFYLIQNSNYVFSEDVLNKTREVLSYDVDLPSMYTKLVNGFNTIDTELVTNIVDEDANTLDNTIQENAIGGAELENIVMETANVEIYEDVNGDDSENINKELQEETGEKVEQEIPQTDEEYIKNNFSFIKPIEGIVTSEFGQRESTNPIVSKNHSGIDIAANLGTVIHSAMDGTVTISSTIGEYGQHIKITNGDVSTLYAHCSKLYVHEGDIISKGQEIAEVGSSGNSTGPHLHFEIIRGNTYINPRNILSF